MFSSRRKRVFIISLDGVPFSFLKEHIENGDLPHIKKIFGEGDLKRYNSVYPTISSVAWSSFMTGKNPASHGIFGFVDRNPDPFRVFIPTGRNLRSKTLFEIASDNDRRTFSFNIPMTTPPRNVNGIMVSGFLSASLHSACYPPEVAEGLHHIGYTIDVDPWKAKSNPDGFIQDIYAALEGRLSAIKKFIESDWDLFMMHIMETDRMNHFYYGVPEGKDTLMEFYRRVDEMMGKIWKVVPGNAEFVSLSDHGFFPIKQEFYINNWLERRGFLKFKKENPESLSDIHPDSIAYSLIPGRVFINLKGREEFGSVKPSNYENVRNELIDTMKELRKEGILKEIFKREEIYQGPFLEESADIILHPVNGYDIKGNINKTDMLGRSHINAMHTYEDAYIYWKEKGLKESNTFSIIDIAPSILNTLGINVPEDTDGRGCLI